MYGLLVDGASYTLRTINLTLVPIDTFTNINYNLPTTLPWYNLLYNKSSEVRYDRIK